jgi:outer membrane protein OmpA-like peptidoglycan-associated protein
MRFNMKLLATAAFTTLLMPAVFVHAEGSAMVDSSMDAPTAYPRAHDYEPPRVELFVGYSYLHAIPAADANRLVWLNGGSTSLAINFNRYLGVVGDFAGFDDSQLRLAGVNAPNVVDSSGTVYSYMFGPRLSFRGHGRITPFVQVLFGGVHASDVTYSNGCTGIGCTPLPAENKFAMTAGGGIDWRLNRHFALRVIQAEYMMTRFENLTTGSSASQNDMRLSTGIVFRFGGHNGPPPMPPANLTYSCSVNPSAVFPGDRIAVTGAAADLNPSRTAVYTWAADGGTVTGTSNTATIDTAGIAVGTYTLKGHVSEGTGANENADCTAPYQVKAYEPPTVSCSANPSSVVVGGSSTITALGVSPQNRPLIYSFSVTTGTVSGSGSTATLSTVGAPLGTSTVTCQVVDDKGQTASATTNVDVAAPAVAVVPAVSELCVVSFARDSRRPARVDNEGKACLDGIALTLQRTSDAKLAVIGNASKSEKASSNLASDRALHTKAYLVSEKGIDPSRIVTYRGSQDAKSATTTLIPAGATLDATGDTPVN